MGSVLLITFEVFVLHIVPDPLCTSIGSIVFKCEGKDTRSALPLATAGTQELILEHPNFQRRKMISRTDPVISD
jgi:hypothetical protein